MSVPDVFGQPLGRGGFNTARAATGMGYFTIKKY
jgi:hypothetical protein